MAGCFAYSPVWDAKTLEAMYCAARLSSDVKVKQQYLDTFNTHYAMRLNGEHEALEWLAERHAYLYYWRGQRFTMAIHKDAFGTTVQGYAQSYILAHEYRNNIEGQSVRALLLQPDASQPAATRSILVFQGTSPAATMDALCRLHQYPTGVDNDTDVAGIGWTSHMVNGPTLLATVRAEIQEGRSVTLCGHSLGGAQVTYLLSSMRAKEQTQCRTYLFGAPAVPHAIAHKVDADAPVWHFRTRNDIVTKAGELHPPGVIIKLPHVDSRWFLGLTTNHTTPQLTYAAINGHMLHYSTRLSQRSDTRLWVEAGRLSLARLRTSRSLTVAAQAVSELALEDNLEMGEYATSTQTAA